MLRIYENKLSMYESVLKFCNNEIASLAIIPDFANCLNEFKEMINQITENSSLQSTKTKGITLNKQKIRQKLILQALDLSVRMVAYAVIHDDPVLRQKIRFTKRKLMNCPAASLNDYAGILISNASQLIAELTVYGVTQTMIDELALTSSELAANLTSPRHAIVIRSGATSALHRLFADADSLLFQRMDKYVAILQFSNKDVFHRYFSNRKLVNSGIRHISIRGKILDVATKVPIEGAKVKLSLKKKPVITRSTGGFRFYSLSGKTCSLKVSHKLYQTRTITSIGLIEGSIKTIDVHLERIYPK